MPIRKSIFSFIILLIFASVPFLYQNCASSHDEGSDKFSSVIKNGQCDKILKNGFSSTGYYDFVKTNCNDCHTSQGTGAGAFADGNVDIAEEHFLLKTEEKIANFSTSNHRAGYTGSQHNDAIATLQTAWDMIETNYIACKASEDEDIDENTIPNKFTSVKAYNVPAGDQILMSWSGAEVGSAVSAGMDVTIEMQLEAFDLGGGATGYYFQSPRIVNNASQSIFIRGLAVRVNGALAPNGQTWYGLEKYIPANDSRQLAPSGGAIILMSEIEEDIEVEIGVVQLENSIIDFAPTTYENLNSAGNVFVTCAPCHTSAGLGGFNIPYNEIVGGLGASGLPLVQKFNPEESLFYTRMLDEMVPMPTAGLLPEDQTNLVRDWILDGAPQATGDVAR